MGPITHEPPLAPTAAEVITRPGRLIAVAAATGIAMEVALHPWLVDRRPPGLGVSLAVAIAVAVLLTSRRWLDRAPTTHARAFGLGAILFGSFIWFRASPALAMIDLIVAGVLIGAAAFSFRKEARSTATVTDYVLAGSDIAFHGSLGAGLIASRDLPATEPSGLRERGRPVIFGVLIAIPLLLVFTGLFVSADAVFGRAISRITSLGLSTGLVQGAMLAVVLAWVSAGLLRRAMTVPPSLGSAASVARHRAH